MKLLKNTQSGRSMVEMLGVLAIIGVLSVGGIAGYSKAMFKHKMNKTLDMLSHAIAKLIEIETSISYDRYVTSFYAENLGFDCDYNPNTERCKIPFGEFGFELSNYSYFMVQFDGDIAQAACFEFLSSGFYKNLPEEWWYPKGYIRVYSEEDNIFYGKSPEAIALGAKDSVNAEDISRVCNTCRDFNDGFEPSCRVVLHIKNGG